MDIQLNGIKKYYDKQLIVNIDKLYLDGGKIYCLMGRNGVGKTTLLRIIAGLDKNYYGSVRFCRNGLLCNEARRHVTMVFQTPYMFDTTVWDNIAYGLKVRSKNREEINEKVNKYLKLMDLESLSHKNALKLSAGQTQRVALARAMVFEPSILLLDEPTSSADDSNKKLITKIIKNINCTNKTTVIMVTHDLEQAQSLSDNILAMNDGKVEQGDIYV